MAVHLPMIQSTDNAVCVPSQSSISYWSDIWSKNRSNWQSTKLPFFTSDNLHSRIKVQIKFYRMGIVLATRINKGRSVPPNENISNPSKGALGCLWRDNLNSVILEHLNTNSIWVNSNSLMKVWAVILMLLWFQTPKQTKYFQQGSFTLTTLQFLSTRSKS